MVSNEYSEAITETLDILNHTRKEDLMKISPKFMEFLKNNASKTYEPKLDHTKQIKDMQLGTKTKAILAIIYKKFWCTEDQAKDFETKLRENEERYQKELQKKYNSENLFKNKNTHINKNFVEVDSKTTAIAEIKEKSFIHKVLDMIKKLFKGKY